MEVSPLAIVSENSWERIYRCSSPLEFRTEQTEQRVPSVGIRFKQGCSHPRGPQPAAYTGVQCSTQRDLQGHVLEARSILGQNRVHAVQVRVICE